MTVLSPVMIVEEQGKIINDEIMRVLTPLGNAYFKTGESADLLIGYALSYNQPLNKLIK